MAAFSLTKTEIIDNIEVLVKRLTGQQSPTYQEKKIIDNAFNAAMVDLCLDSGISSWRFMQVADTETTTAGTEYVDLDENIFNVISGTVRIAAEDITLSPMSMEYDYQTDPDRDDTGAPRLYRLGSSSDAETMRMYFKPIPDATYTVAFVGESVPDEDSISTFPAWTHACLKDKSAANALRDLGLAEKFPMTLRSFEASYERRKQDNKASQGHDIPMHINRACGIYRGRGIQSRLPD